MSLDGMGIPVVCFVETRVGLMLSKGEGDVGTLLACRNAASLENGNGWMALT